MVDFTKILATKVEDVKRPPLIPAGTYRARVSKPASFDEISNGRFKVIDFQMLLVEPQLDVDQDALAAYGGLNPGSQLRHRFMFGTEDGPDAKAREDRTLFNLKRFLSEHLGVQGDSLNELVANAQGNECLVTVAWRPDPNDAEIQYNEIRKTAPLSV